MGPQPAHGLGFTGDALPAFVIEAFGLDEGKGNVPVQQRVVRQIDLLLAALAQEADDLVAAAYEGSGDGGSEEVRK